MAREQISMTIRDGDVVQGYAWTIEKPIGNVVIVTGMAEKALRYDDFATFLTNNGYNVYCLDHYGQGLTAGSEDKLGIVPPSFFSKSVKNLDALIVKLRVSCLPTVIIGHSMGSFMVQDYIQRYTEHVNKVVICGSNGPNGKLLYWFGYQLARLLVHKRNRNKVGKLFVKLSFGPYEKSVKDAKTNYDWLSYNRENVSKYIDDPYCGYDSSNGFFKEFLKGNNRLFKRKFLKKIRKDMSILLVAGKEDPVGSFAKGPQALLKMYKKLGLTDVDLKLYDHMRHEILNEDEKQKVYEDILKFIQSEHDVAESFLK